MTQSNLLHKEEIPAGNADDRRMFWGTVALSGLLILISIYFLTILFRQPLTAITLTALLFFLSVLAASAVSVVLAIRKQQLWGLQIAFVATNFIGLMAAGLVVERTLPSSLSILLISIIILQWAMPSHLRRQYALFAATVFALMWTIEWISPPWRIQLAAATVGPAAAVIFVLILAIHTFVQTREAINRSLRLKLVAWTGGIVVVLSVILVGYSIVITRQTSIENAQTAALAVAESQARQIRADAETPLDTARALAQALTAIKDPQASLALSRDQVNAILRQVLAENPSFLGTYTLWEPNAFDGLDAEYRNQPVHDETGRFIPYWIRSDDGSIVVIPLEQYETAGIGDWYVLPRQNKREMTFAPLIYPINGVDTVMASFIVPIMYNDTFYGIAGVDAPIGFVQEIVDSINLYDGKADAVLLTSSGTLIGVRNRPDLVNQPATEIYADFDQLQARIEAGESFISLSPDGNSLRVFAPVDLGQTGQHWSFGLIIPFSEVTAPATAAAVQQVAISLGLIVLFILFLWYLTNQIARPIIELTNTANAITQGNLDIAANIQSRDETGILANAFNTMTSQLRGILTTLEQRVADRTRNLELAAEVGRSISEVRALDVMLREACELIQKEFDLYYVQVYLVDPAQTTLRLKAGTGNVGAELLARSHSLPIDTGSINGRAAIDKRSVVISDTTQSATFRRNPLLPETHGEMAVPLIVAERVVGVLDMQSSAPGVLTREVLPAFEALAGQLAIAIQNASLLAEAEHARAQMEAQARHLVRKGWGEHLDAIHKPENLGFVFEHDKVVSLAKSDEAQFFGDEKAISVPISVTGESLGSLVVEIADESRREQTSELVNVVARQVAQQIENLRLLESAERYQHEAEKASRLQTVEGWKQYIESRPSGKIGFLYDTKEVRPLDGTTEDASAFIMPLKVRNELIGKLSVEGVTHDDRDAVELVGAVADRLTAYIENLRQFDETRRGQIELDKRAQQLAAVAEISTASSKELDIQNMLESVVFLTQRKFDLYHAHVFLYNEHTSMLTITACGWKEGGENEGTHGTTSIPLLQEQSLVARAARTRQAVIVNDVRNEPGWLPNPLLPDTASEMAVPLVIGDQILGVLDVQSDRLNAFTEEDASIQTTLASQVATALQNARSFDRAQKQAERESKVNVISQKIQSATTVEAVLQIAARELGHALGAPMTIAQLSMKDKEK